MICSAQTLDRGAVPESDGDSKTPPSVMVNIAIAGATGGTQMDLPHPSTGVWSLTTRRRRQRGDRRPNRR